MIAPLAVLGTLTFSAAALVFQAAGRHIELVA
jgi:hypothetical protein